MCEVIGARHVRYVPVDKRKKGERVRKPGSEASFGPLAGVVWRVGVMGYNARQDAVLTTLSALESELRLSGLDVPPGGGVSAALAHYEEELA